MPSNTPRNQRLNINEILNAFNSMFSSFRKIFKKYLYIFKNEENIYRMVRYNDFLNRELECSLVQIEWMNNRQETEVVGKKFSNHEYESFKKIVDYSFKLDSPISATEMEHSAAAITAMLSRTNSEANFAITNAKYVLFEIPFVSDEIERALSRGVKISVIVIDHFWGNKFDILESFCRSYPDKCTIKVGNSKSKPEMKSKSSKEHEEDYLEFDTFDSNMFLLWLSNYDYCAVGGVNDIERTSKLINSFQKASEISSVYRIKI